MALKYAGDFELDELVFESIPGIEWDIKLLMAEANIYEDIFNSTLTGNIVLDDADNRINNFPITGFEYIRFKFRTPDKSYITLRLRVFKIDQRELEKERRQVFIMHFVSSEEFTNAQSRVSKSYNQKLISDIADDIQTTYFSPFSTLETTKILHHIIPAYWTPFKTLNFLASRANSAAFNGANYLYFQTCDGFNFCSLELLCSQVAKIKYLLQPANIRNQDEDSDPERTLDVDEVAIQSFKFTNMFDTLDNVSNGMYHGRLLWHDIRTGQFGETGFDYPTSYKDYVHVEPNIVKDGSSYLWTSKSADNGTFGANKFFPLGQPESSNSVKTWLLQRISQLQQIENVKMHLTVPGDSDRRVGDIVIIALPSPEPLVENQLVMDKYYQDRYLVTSVRHKLSKQEYTTILEVVKDSVFTAFP
jgi:hypothetical protein